MKTKILLLFLLAVLVVFSIVACGDNDAPIELPLPEHEIQNIGTGDTVIYFQVTDAEGGITLLRIHTDATTVSSALGGVGLIAGQQTDFGLMVTHVQGMRADFDEDGAWWAFYINGEQANEGVDTTNVVAGTIYAFVFTPA